MGLLVIWMLNAVVIAMNYSCDEKYLIDEKIHTYTLLARGLLCGRLFF